MNFSGRSHLLPSATRDRHGFMLSKLDCRAIERILLLCGSQEPERHLAICPGWRYLQQCAFGGFCCHLAPDITGRVIAPDLSRGTGEGGSIETALRVDYSPLHSL